MNLNQDINRIRPRRFERGGRYALLLVSALYLAIPVSAQAPATSPESAPNSPRDLAAFIEPMRAQHDLPSLAAAVWINGKVVASGATGLRRLGDDTPVTRDDKYHIGSCGKSMTATLMAMLVDEGKLEWDTTLAEIFPDRVNDMLAEYREVTIKQLLSHTAGLPNPWESAGIEWHEVKYEGADTPPEQRLAMIKQVLAMPPLGTPGTVQEYSNHGYGIAAAIIEKATGKTWEALLHERIFESLGMSSAGVGRPADGDRDGQPWGHTFVDGQWKPIDPTNPRFRVPGAIASAGDIHCTIAEFARWVGAHVQGLREDDPLLVTVESYRVMHEPVMTNYAMGWRVEVSSGGTEIHMHNGSESTFFATMAAIPELNMAIVTATNGGWGDRACNALIFKLANKFAEEAE